MDNDPCGEDGLHGEDWERYQEGLSRLRRSVPAGLTLKVSGTGFADLDMADVRPRWPYLAFTTDQVGDLRC